jgi:hypothetical protein
MPSGGRFRGAGQIDPRSPPSPDESGTLGLAQVGDGAAERFGELAIPSPANRTLSCFPCLDRVTRDAEPFGELPWRQTGALARPAQIFR